MCLVFVFLGLLISCSSTIHIEADKLHVNVSEGHLIPPHFFGVFFEEINHAGAGGLWAELVDNRGFEAGGHVVPSMITPWGLVGDDNEISVVTELSSCLETNPVALRMDVLCNQTSCPPGGVGVYNPGYWGMNIEEDQSYRVVFYLRSSGKLGLTVSFVSENGTQVLDSQQVTAEAKTVENWTKMEVTLRARASCPKSRLEFTTSQEGTIWLDQVSAMPNNTYKGHGFRSDLIEMVLKLKPKFLRFPGGCYVEGNFLSNAYRWKQTIGPWENRSGHHSDVWGYWSDDGLGYLEYLQLAEDLEAEPVWVVNSGIAYGKDEIDTSLIAPFVQEMLDSIEFARGSRDTRWGSRRAKLGHPAPFRLNYVAIGNENCDRKVYKGNYLKFYRALKNAYPDINIISNCDGSEKPLDHPADLYDYHTYPDVLGVLNLTHHFDKKRSNDPRAPKAFVSEYAVTNPPDKVKNGSFEAALAEAAFLLSLEQNSDLVDMVSYAPLFANHHDRWWNPDAIIFNCTTAYGIPSYWVQTFFKHSSGAFLMNVNQTNIPKNMYMTIVSSIYQDEQKKFITVKVVNFEKLPSKMSIHFDGVDQESLILTRKTEFACSDLNCNNTFERPNKVVPVSTKLQEEVREELLVEVQPYSFTSFDIEYK